MPAKGHAPARRVELDKYPAEYLVIADDSDPVTNVADYFREDRVPERQVLYVERRADDPEERRAQWDELEGACLDGELSLLTYTAVSHGRAVYLARWEYAVASAADRMAEVIDSHLERGARGWVAIRIADGGSDGELYDEYGDARAAQVHPDRCTYLRISPLWPWTSRKCEEELDFWRHVRHGCMSYGIPTCR